MVLAAVCISLSGASSIAPQPLNLIQFKNMIQCNNTQSWWNFIDYGCYCGYGANYTAVDELDRCCQTHFNCYSQAMDNPACTPILDSPYIKTYSYTCSEGSLTCNGDNDVCGALVCNCDLSAANCFAGAPFIEENYNMDPERCQ
uniref:phospholipase A2 n=1 Tax=Micrurus spixii TaxID=129469 RepID=A0A2D4LKP4_9SAUR